MECSQRLFCARPSCDQVALWAIKAPKKQTKKDIKRRGSWEDLWQQRSRPGPNPKEVVVRLWPHCCRTGNSCPPAWCLNLRAISYSANTDHHTWRAQTLMCQKKWAWFYVCNVKDVLIIALDYCYLNSAICKNRFLGNILQFTAAQSKPMTCKINGDMNQTAALHTPNTKPHSSPQMHILVIFIKSNFFYSNSFYRNCSLL